MKSRIKCRIQKPVITVAIAFSFYFFQGIELTQYQAKSSEVKPNLNADTESLHQTSKLSRPPIIDILPRLYTAEEVYSQFKEHEFRATNNFKKCRLMVTGIIKSIGTATFSKNPLVTLDISGSKEGMKFIFENTDYDNDKVATLNVGDTVIIAGWNARPGTFEGIFLDNSQIMTDMVSKKKRQILAINGGIYDREICYK
ncbi:OB-fold putative lipoprotein [Pantoea sp. DY-5]|uniref:OB-fold putative lipoprotein n=1 Tax=Pantoea sp. DY-5 TaxID=2871488 RepID=UPI001C96CAE7|nr:OB-fold putative lipoprotein [Pantoea sp. DY-5]MBY4839568.1 OB-fold putative lipoprotein [Pantoea sp. DY-5]